MTAPKSLLKENWDSTVLLEEVHLVLQKIKEIGRLQKKKIGFCIGNTTKKIERDYFFTPLRNAAQCVCGSIIIDRVAIAEVIARAIDGEVDYIFVDTEKKISPELYGAEDAGNVERTFRSTICKSKILTFKGNDLTVDSLDCFLAQFLAFDMRGLGAKKVAVIGAGNIGFKIALKLVERGAHVFMVRRNTKVLSTIVRALNFVKPRSTLAKIVGTSNIGLAMENADVVIGVTPGTQDITAAMLASVKPSAVLIDAGKGSFSSEAVEEAGRRCLQIFRSSIISSFEGQIAMLLKMEELLQGTVGRGTIEGVPVVSGNIVGFKGEIVVDNFICPAEIYGVADGCGDFNRSPSEHEEENLRILSRWIDLKQRVRC